MCTGRLDGKELDIVLKDEAAFSLTWVAVFSEGEADSYMRLAFWGYPSLQVVNKFFVDLRPALVQARDERRARTERAEHEGRASSKIEPDSPHQISNDKNQDQHAATSISQAIQVGPSVSPRVMPDPPDGAKKDAKQHRQVDPENLSPSSDKIPLPTTSENREVLGFTTGDPTEQLGVPDGRERSNHHNEIEEIQEIQYTSEHTIEGLHILQNA